MKRLLVSILIAVILCTSGCTVVGYGPPITGSGVLKTQEFSNTGFYAIAVSSAFTVDIVRADSFSISITLDDNLYDYLQVKQQSRTLIIQMAPGHTYVRSTRKASITLPNLHSLELSWASKAKISGFSSSDRFDANVSGASDLNMVSMRSGDSRFEISGASHISGSADMVESRFDISGASTAELSGSATNVLIEVTGASQAKLSQLTVIDANVTVSGASRATINASGRLDADVSGASTLSYLGNPTLGRINSSGASTIRQEK